MLDFPANGVLLLVVSMVLIFAAKAVMLLSPMKTIRFVPGKSYQHFLLK